MAGSRPSSASTRRCSSPRPSIHPLDGSASRQITHFTDGRFIGHYAWSNDGQRLAVSRVSFRSDIVLFRNLPGRPQ
jgi:hypothetical protein